MQQLLQKHRVWIKLKGICSKGGFPEHLFSRACASPRFHTAKTQSGGSPPSNDALRKAYSITSSARASSDGGTVRPSAFAVLRLITNSYLVGACTGRSAAFSPLRMRST